MLVFSIVLSDVDFKQNIVDKFNEENPDYFSIFDACKFYDRLVWPIIILSPVFVVYNIIRAIVKTIYGVICDSGNIR
jgi:hypothetical protein